MKLKTRKALQSHLHLNGTFINSPPESVVFRGHLVVLVLLLLEILEPLLLGHQLLLLHLYLLLLPGRHLAELDGGGLGVEGGVRRDHEVGRVLQRRRRVHYVVRLVLVDVEGSRADPVVLEELRSWK